MLLLVKLQAEAQNTDDPQNIIFVNNVSPARAVVNWNQPNIQHTSYS